MKLRIGRSVLNWHDIAYRAVDLNYYIIYVIPSAAAAAWSPRATGITSRFRCAQKSFRESRVLHARWIAGELEPCIIISIGMIHKLRHLITVIFRRYISEEHDSNWWATWRLVTCAVMHGAAIVITLKQTGIPQGTWFDSSWIFRVTFLLNMALPHYHFKIW